jgi:hypothetical protein
VSGVAVTVKQDFTGDRDKIDQALGALEGLRGGTPADAKARLASLKTAFAMLAPLEGKKLVVYFGSGESLNTPDAKPQLEDTIHAAQRANVAIYSIDTRGLVVK